MPTRGWSIMAASIALWIPILLLAILGLIVAGLPLVLGRLIRPTRPNPGKLATYESGEVPVGRARGPVDVQYYMYVIVFLVLDVEVLFLIPWALGATALGRGALEAMAIFVGLILLGWLYDWKKGALTWQT